MEWGARVLRTISFYFLPSIIMAKNAHYSPGHHPLPLGVAITQTQPKRYERQKKRACSSLPAFGYCHLRMWCFKILLSFLWPLTNWSRKSIKRGHVFDGFHWAIQPTLYSPMSRLLCKIKIPIVYSTFEFSVTWVKSTLILGVNKLLFKVKIR